MLAGSGLAHSSAACPRGTGHYPARRGQPGSGMLSRSPTLWEITSPPPLRRLPRDKGFFVLDFVLATNASRVFPNAVRASLVLEWLAAGRGFIKSRVSAPLELTPPPSSMPIRCDFAARPPLHRLPLRLAPAAGLVKSFGARFGFFSVGSFAFSPRQRQSLTLAPPPGEKNAIEPPPPGVPLETTTCESRRRLATTIALLDTICRLLSCTTSPR